MKTYCGMPLRICIATANAPKSKAIRFGRRIIHSVQRKISASHGIAHETPQCPAGTLRTCAAQSPNATAPTAPPERPQPIMRASR